MSPHHVGIMWAVLRSYNGRGPHVEQYFATERLPVKMTYAESNDGSTKYPPSDSERRPSLNTRGVAETAEAPTSSPTSSDATFFSVDSDMGSQSGGQATPTAREDAEDQIPGDLLSRIPDMFRVLDLVGEQSSGGIGKYSAKKRNMFNPTYDFLSLVDKVVIDQESFSRFINTLSPGAYSSMTKISFANLDKLHLRPIGVYGSRAEISKLLQSLGAVDNELFVLGFNLLQI
jgi:hypothetical protein